MRERRLAFTDRARSDLLAARRWLSQPGAGLKAGLRIARIHRALAELRYTPDAWPLTDHADVRKRTVEGYAIFYRSDDAQVVRILRIFAPGQDRSDL